MYHDLSVAKQGCVCACVFLHTRERERLLLNKLYLIREGLHDDTDLEYSAHLTDAGAAAALCAKRLCFV